MIILHQTLYEGTEVRVSPLPILKSAAILGEGHVRMNSGLPLGAENSPWLTTRKKTGDSSPIASRNQTLTEGQLSPLLQLCETLSQEPSHSEPRLLTQGANKCMLF